MNGMPLHFGSSRERLFGMYHAAAATRPRRAGVVICAPFGHEYIRAHRALRQLAMRLADRGYHVLRFDYFGTGDSDGEGSAVTVATWRADVARAVDELKELSGVGSVCLIGMRLGGTVAADVASDRQDVAATLLWDPIVDGRQYLRALTRLQRRWLRGRPGSHLFAWRRDVSEVIGFPVTAALRASLAAVACPPSVAGGPARIVLHDAGADWDEPHLVHSALNCPEMIARVAATVEEHVA